MKITGKIKPLVFVPLALVAAAGLIYFLAQKISVATATAEIVQLLLKSDATAEQKAEIQKNLERLASQSQDEACPGQRFGSPLRLVAESLRWDLKQYLSDGKLSKEELRAWRQFFETRCSTAIN